MLTTLVVFDPEGPMNENVLVTGPALALTVAV
jgi:hypothetical protein